MDARLARAGLRIRAARPQEGERLRAIAIAAKSVWGYDLERVRRWAAAGDFSPAGLRKKEIYVAEIDGRAVGWVSSIPKGEVCWLDDLWVEPAWFGRGIGTRLFEHAAGRGRQLGSVRMEWEAEPHAIGFYKRMGARHVREGEPGAWGRISPVMGVALSRRASPRGRHGSDAG